MARNNIAHQGPERREVWFTGVHKKHGMNTSRATVDCGLIFSEKEVSKALPQPSTLGLHQPVIRVTGNLEANV